MQAGALEEGTGAQGCDFAGMREFLGTVTRLSHRMEL